MKLSTLREWLVREDNRLTAALDAFDGLVNTEENANKLVILTARQQTVCTILDVIDGRKDMDDEGLVLDRLRLH